MTSSVFASDRFARSLFFPGPDPSRPPPGADDRWLEVDGARLRVRVHHGERGRLLVCFPGNGEHAGSYDDLADRFTALAGGIAVAFCEYRGYGQSTGTPTYPDLIADARRLVAWLAADRPAGAVALYGRSLGSQAALHALDAAAAPPAALIIDSGFSDLDAFVARRGLGSVHIGDRDRARYQVLARARAFAGPLLVVHGEADEVIDPDDGAALASGPAAGPRRLVRVPGHGHNDLFAAPAHGRALDEFLRQVWPA